MKIKINIIDYGVGNTHSVKNALAFLGYKATIGGDEKVIKASDVLILPGVGAFDEAMKNLKERKLDILLNEEVLEKKETDSWCLCRHADAGNFFRGKRDS